jgi:hypothetical protein
MQSFCWADRRGVAAFFVSVRTGGGSFVDRGRKTEG